MNWFYGFKLHLVINHLGELMSFCLTPGNINDGEFLLWLFKGLQGLGASDQGYISKEKAAVLARQNLNFITRVKRNIKPKAFSFFAKLFLSQRCIVETVTEQLKFICHIDHTRHHNPFNFLINLLLGLVAYILKPRKPRIKLNFLPRKFEALMPS